MRPLSFALGGALLTLLVLPLVGLSWSASSDALLSAPGSESFAPAVWLSLRTSLVTLVVLAVSGTPLAWYLARPPTRLSRVVSVLVDLPIVIPPAVTGVALLYTFGRAGLLGPTLGVLGVSLPFTEAAVVLAQVVVAAPFYVQAAANAFRKVDPDLLVVARSLGAAPHQVAMRVVLPIAAPGLVAGASIAWARALGEFGATLLFAGNLKGRTQTMPLAIMNAMQSDPGVAVALSLWMAAVGAILLVALRGIGERTQ